MEELDQALEKKRGQLKKAEERLGVKKRRNQRLRARRVKYSGLIEKSEGQIEEYKRLIEYHEGMVADWKQKLAEVPQDENFEDELTKRDKVKDELTTMEVLRWEIKTIYDDLGRPNMDGVLKEALEEKLAKTLKKFKSAKGNGF